LSPDAFRRFNSNRGGNPATFNIWRIYIDGSDPRQLAQ
jgi:hypothetical protein